MSRENVSLFNLIEEKAHHSQGYSIAYAILMLADATDRNASALRALGNADAATPMGAMEAFGLVVKEGLEQVAGSIDNISQSIDNAG